MDVYVWIRKKETVCVEERGGGGGGRQAETDRQMMLTNRRKETERGGEMRQRKEGKRGMGVRRVRVCACVCVGVCSSSIYPRRSLCVRSFINLTMHVLQSKGRNLFVMQQDRSTYFITVCHSNGQSHGEC